jgi:hypothetical protein
LSMGGMVAIEISKILNPRFTIIISSITGHHELPWYYKLAGALHLHKLAPASFFSSPTSIAFYLIGAHDPDSKKLLSQLTKDSNPAFVKWALSGILKWRNKVRPENLFHIHGTKDKILPVHFTKPDACVEGGGHFMVYTLAGQVSKLITDKILSLQL